MRPCQRLVCNEHLRSHWQGNGTRQLTPLLPVGSRAVPQALVLLRESAELGYHGRKGDKEMASKDLHKRVIDCDDEDLARVLQLGVVDESRHMASRAGGTWTLRVSSCLGCFDPCHCRQSSLAGGG